LTGEKDNSFSASACDYYIGRLGTYINQIASRSTPCKSPHFQLQRVEGAPDFDPNWKSILIQISRTRDAAATQTFTVEEVADDMKAAHREMSSIYSEIGSSEALPEPAGVSPNL
jgi:hypothetical protein